MEMKTQNQISHDMWFKEWGHSIIILIFNCVPVVLYELGPDTCLA